MGFNLRHLLYQQGEYGAEYVRRSVEKVFALWDEGKIKPTVDTTWALEDVAEAMQKVTHSNRTQNSGKLFQILNPIQMHDRKNIGKLILDPAQTPKPKPATPAKGKSKDKKQAAEEKNGDKDKKVKDHWVRCVYKLLKYFICTQTEGDAEAEEKKDEEKAEENGTNSQDEAGEDKSPTTNGEGNWIFK